MRTWSCGRRKVLVVAGITAIAATGATCQRPWPPDGAPPGVLDAPRVESDAPTVEMPDLTRGGGMPVDQALVASRPPPLPPTIGLRHIADAYVVVDQEDEDCGETLLTVALADRPARP